MKKTECIGQLNLIDFMSSINPNRRPYEYDFNRYVGQHVRIWIQGEEMTGRITAFDHYYTEVITDDGEEYACTHLNVAPIEE